MLRDAWLGRACSDDGGGGSAGECISVGDGSSNSNLQCDSGVRRGGTAFVSVERWML
jgi:hypothetical protein